MRFPQAKQDLIDFQREAGEVLLYGEGTRYYGEPSEDHWEVLRVEATRQADELRALASAIQRVGIPVQEMSVTFKSKSFLDDHDTLRGLSTRMAALINAIGKDFFPGVDRKKIESDSYWGLELKLPAGMKLRYSIFNEATCEIVPITDDEGQPVMETIEKSVYHTEKVEQQVTKKICVPLFRSSNA